MKLSQELIDIIKKVASEKLRESVEVDFCTREICGENIQFYDFFNSGDKFNKSKDVRKSGSIIIYIIDKTESTDKIHISYRLYESKVAHIDQLIAFKNALIEEYYDDV